MADYITRAADDWTPSVAGELLPRDALVLTLWRRRARAALRFIEGLPPAPFRQPTRFDTALPPGEFFGYLYGLAPGRAP